MFSVCFLKSIPDFVPSSVDVIVYGGFRVYPLDHLFSQFGFPLLPVGVFQVVFQSDVCSGRIWIFEDTEDRNVSPAGVSSWQFTFCVSMLCVTEVSKFVCNYGQINEIFPINPIKLRFAVVQNQRIRFSI